MDGTEQSTLLAKALWSGMLVLGLAFIAERVSTRLAGIVSGAPLNIVLVYVFVGLDLGVEHVIASIPHSISSFTATFVFVLGYYAGSVWFRRFAVAGSVALGLTGYFAVAMVLERVAFDILTAFLPTVTALALTAWIFSRIGAPDITRPVRYTPALLLLRGGAAAALVVVVITLAQASGPRWTGLLTGFPATILPTLVILHVTYGAEAPRALLRNFPLAMGSILIFIMGVRWGYPSIGVLPGTVLGLAGALAYLAALALRDGRKGRAGAQ